MGECPYCGSTSLSCGCSGPSHKSTLKHMMTCRDGACCMPGLMNMARDAESEKKKVKSKGKKK